MPMNDLITDKDRDIIELILTNMRDWLEGRQAVFSYQEILSTWGLEFENYRINWRREAITNSYRLFALRERWINEFGFFIPCAEVLDSLASAKCVLEVGAGTGFMTRLMKHRGIPVIGSDPALMKHGFEVGRYDSGQYRLQAKTAVRRFWNADTVFCSWPSYDETWFRQMLKAMRIGQRLVVVRESATADETAWDYYESSFEEIDAIDIPCFYGLHDYVCVAVKKRHGAHEPNEKKKPIKLLVAELRDSTEKLAADIGGIAEPSAALENLEKNLRAAVNEYDGGIDD
jgi:hypothetical protein